MLKLKLQFLQPPDAKSLLVGKDPDAEKFESKWGREEIDEDKVETVIDFIFLGSKITVDGDCSHEIKRCLLLGRKAMTNPDSILKKQRHH